MTLRCPYILLRNGLCCVGGRTSRRSHVHSIYQVGPKGDTDGLVHSGTAPPSTPRIPQTPLLLSSR